MVYCYIWFVLIYCVYCVMFIKQINKKNTKDGKVFPQYHLVQSYRIGDKVSQNYILYLGDNELLKDKTNWNIIAKLLENKINGNVPISDDMLGVSKEILDMVDEYYQKYLHKNRSKEELEKEKQDYEARFETVDTESTKVIDCREIGAEAMSKRMLDRIGLRDFLKQKAWKEKDIDHAYIAIISRAVFRASEHRTEHWLANNSGLLELFRKKVNKVTRHDLYKSSKKLYDIKDELEIFFYDRLTDMFNIKNSIFIYDLTNTYFEGRKANSKIAKFGRNKEKRNDCKQVVLAAVINEQGFLNHSRIYEGNMSDPMTVLDLVKALDKSCDRSSDNWMIDEHIKKPMIVMDAGIATENNLILLREKGYEYVCVSRSKPKKDDKVDKENAIEIKSKKEEKILLKFMETKDNKDRWVYVKSEGKQKKEISMNERALQKYEEELEIVSQGVKNKYGTKKVEKVWERIGRIKERNKKVNKYYDIQIETNKDIVTEILWQRKEIEPNESSGEYYLRTNGTMRHEREVWDIYNMVREVESTFRCLKTDMKLRPIYHKTDDNTEAHLHLGLLAYNIVAPIRYQLKEHDINIGWTNIVRIMDTQKICSVAQKTKDNKTITTRTCSQPTPEAMEIYRSLNMSSIPLAHTKFVVYHAQRPSKE